MIRCRVRSGCVLAQPSGRKHIAAAIRGCSVPEHLESDK